MPSPHQKIGAQGETLARSFLEKKGFIFVEKNIFTPFGEIDLMFRDNETLVFVEVKYRNNPLFGTAAESMSETKQRRFQKSCYYYLNKNLVNGEHPEFRIDFLGIDRVDQEHEFTYIPFAF
ncbi:YraN family protein [Candidatus Peregrinibacteria bacterium]|nr:MAG: YraN family protein [Candidatus Peregrinibacteria bacterium]